MSSWCVHARVGVLLSSFCTLACCSACLLHCPLRSVHCALCIAHCALHVFVFGSYEFSFFLLLSLVACLPCQPPNPTWRPGNNNEQRTHQLWTTGHMTVVAVNTLSLSLLDDASQGLLHCALLQHKHTDRLTERKIDTHQQMQANTQSHCHKCILTQVQPHTDTSTHNLYASCPPPLPLPPSPKQKKTPQPRDQCHGCCCCPQSGCASCTSSRHPALAQLVLRCCRRCHGIATTHVGTGLHRLPLSQPGLSQCLRFPPQHHLPAPSRPQGSTSRPLQQLLQRTGPC